MTANYDFKTIFRLHQTGKLQEALPLYLQFLERQPDHIDALVSLANLYLQMGNATESAHYFERALELKPRKLLALHNYAMCLKQLKLFDRALQYFDRALIVDPCYELAYKNKLALLTSLGKHSELKSVLQTAVKNLPESLNLRMQLASVLQQEKNYADALEEVDAVLQRRPNAEQAHNLRASILLGMGRETDAVLAYQAAIQINPNYTNAYGNLGIAYLSLCDYQRALDNFDRALTLEPNVAGVRNNRANALQNLHRFEEALLAYEDILDRNPRDSVAAANKGMLCLLTGRWKEGWSLYEARWQNAAMSIHAELFSYPLWNGSNSLEGKIIILHPEQGFGDTIQFSRYAALLAKQAEKVYLVVNDPLYSLMQHSITQWPEAAKIEVMTAGAQIPVFHYQLPLLSAPRVLKTELRSIPNSGPYLFVEPKSRAKWQEILGATKRPRIGLVWSGSEAHTNDKNRSIALDQLVSQFQQFLHPEIEFHALQKEIKVNDLALLARLSIQNHTTQITNFSDTAGLIACMDLVISVDTSVAHLAAAMGVETWIALSYVPDFRWLLERRDSPWYDSVKLFRQVAPRQWSTVLKDLALACNRRFDRPVLTSLGSAQLSNVAGVVGTARTHPPSEMNVANGLVQQGKWDDAEAIYRQEAARFGSSAKLHNNWGVALQKLRRYQEALDSFDIAIRLDPTYVSPHLNKAMCLLSLGDFAEGWHLYEWRWKNSQWDASRREFRQARWTGEQDIRGRRILIYTEQGLGDTLQFCRLLALLQNRGAEIVFEVQAPLFKLLQCLPVTVFMTGEAPQNFDFQCPLMSLPHALQLRVETIPQAIPYLRIDQTTVDEWRKKIESAFPVQANRIRRKIGLVWAGSVHHLNDAQRSIPFAIFSKLFQYDADFVILQKEIRRSDRMNLELLRNFGKRIAIVDADLNDFADTAGALSQLDCLISVDTSVAHLAGALGIPVSLLLPYEADFRWMIEREDSPWYPSMRLYRQIQVGDWNQVIEKVRSDLQSLDAPISQKNA
ncbi:tetratricopeptide repeat protein [Undibacterium fentianense]|uniref:Tetratricopeptide repeat protein n=1 Tax=Undibacterium fentianense TaxID=2828728 RepID=A0A941IDW1_9BURK|nr:tetratricopeptide repeat protein [Undibacterium fentianense]MBR7801739.1 tetratricopeptide repeat protein [Undibacterium fentianense]